MPGDLGLTRLQINDHAAMTWDNDLFGRKQYADRLTTLVHNTLGPYVIGLASPWGSGKTFFLQAWRRQLLADSKPCIYFNAWEQDASGDPLVNLMAAIHHQAQQTSWPQMLHAMRDAVLKLADFAVQLMKGAAFGLGATGNPEATMANAGAEGLKSFTDRISGYYSTVRQFNAELTKLAAATAGMAGGFPLFIMVDELDRCRPSYAIDLLERIKHLFNVPHVVFLLAVDSSQLLQQVEHTFGLKRVIEDETAVCDCRMDYLGKFFDVFYTLPQVDKRIFVRSLLERIPMLGTLTERFKKEGYILYSLAGILSSEALLFADKSLRTLAQRAELFSVFVRTYAGSSFEEIFLAYIAIFSLTDGYFKNAQKDIEDNLIKLNKNLEHIYKLNCGKYIFGQECEEEYDCHISFYFLVHWMQLNREDRVNILMHEKDMTTTIIDLHANIIYRKDARNLPRSTILFYGDLLEEVDKKLRFLSEFSALPRANA